MQVSDHFQQSLLLMKSLFFSDHDLADVSAKSVYRIYLFNLFSGRFDGFCRYGHPDVVCPLVNYSCSQFPSSRHFDDASESENGRGDEEDSESENDEDTLEV